MWSRLPTRFVARMLHGHSVLGLAASALLYILCLSGTVMVFHDEFARWEQPGIPEFETAAPHAVHAAAENAIARVDERPHHFFLGLPVDGMPRLSVTADESSWYADADGNLLDPVQHDWAEFLENLHYYLTLPGVLGLTVVGILGMLMTALVFSGVLSHPSLFRDAFKLRLGASARVREADLHNRLSVWGAPFHLVIAFTGGAIGLASVVALCLAPVFIEADDSTAAFEQFFEPIFGEEIEGNKEAAPLADISTALENFTEQYPGTAPWYVSFHDPATVGQSAEILAKHPRRLVYGDNYYFDQFGNITGNTGLSDGAIGQQVVASMYPLHFGSFGGITVKIIYGVLGLLSCVVVASGVNIWLLKRRQRGRPAPVLERAWHAIVWGTPMCLAVVLAITIIAGASLPVSTGTFWSSLLLLIAVAAVKWKHDFRSAWSFSTAALVLATVVLHAASDSAPMTFLTIGMNIVLLALAVVMTMTGFVQSRRKHQV